MSSRAMLEITVHSIFFTLLMSPVLGTETISSDEGSIDISDTF